MGAMVRDSSRVRIFRGAVALVTLVAPFACGPGGFLKPPSAPAFIDDTDPERARVTMTKNPSAPLIVDWQPENRGDLEVAIKRGVAVVHFDEKSFVLLPQCRARGNYNYVGYTPKSQNMTIRSRAELQANLPYGAFKLEGKLGQEGAVMVALRMVGQRMFDSPHLSRDKLEGDCARATHYISALTIGAFRYATTAHASAEAAASIFGAGGGGKTSGEAENVTTDGDFGACDGADPDAESAPSRCRALLRINLVPLDGAVASASEGPKCGEGMKWNGQMCVTERRIQQEAQQSPTSEPAQSSAVAKGYECSEDDANECKEQCRAGNLPSCNRFAGFLAAGAGGFPQDVARAVKLWGIGCQSNYAPACTSLGMYLESKRLFHEAAEIGGKGCRAGDPGACTNVAVLAYFGRGVAKNRQAAFQLWLRGCKLRDWTACSNVGAMLLHGTDGAPNNPEGARKLFTAACEAPGKVGCGNLAETYEHGLGGPKDTAKALELYLASCDAGGATSCVAAGLLTEENSTKLESRQRALALYEKGCGMGPGGGCATVQEVRAFYPGEYTDEGYDRRACDDGDQRALACYNAAIATERGYGGSVDLAKATRYLDLACRQGGLKKACRPPRAR